MKGPLSKSGRGVKACESSNLSISAITEPTVDTMQSTVGSFICSEILYFLPNITTISTCLKAQCKKDQSVLGNCTALQSKEENGIVKSDYRYFTGFTVFFEEPSYLQSPGSRVNITHTF